MTRPSGRVLVDLALIHKQTRSTYLQIAWFGRACVTYDRQHPNLSACLYDGPSATSCLQGQIEGCGFK
eukprot:13211089-Alexandrium_andersonii.AAC.1